MLSTDPKNTQLGPLPGSWWSQQVALNNTVTPISSRPGTFETLSSLLLDRLRVRHVNEVANDSISKVELMFLLTRRLLTWRREVREQFSTLARNLQFRASIRCGRCGFAAETTCSASVPAANVCFRTCLGKLRRLIGDRH